jgi:hypothetical protein
MESSRSEPTGQKHTSYEYRYPKRKLLNDAKRRARKAGLPFDLCEEDFLIPSVCPVLGLRLGRGLGDCSPSLDRIVPHLGYVRGNVIVVSTRANRLKGDATLDELLRLAEFYQRIMK